MFLATVFPKITLAHVKNWAHNLCYLCLQSLARFFIFEASCWRALIERSLSFQRVSFDSGTRSHPQMEDKNLWNCVWPSQLHNISETREVLPGEQGLLSEIKKCILLSCLPWDNWLVKSTSQLSFKNLQMARLAVYTTFYEFILR